MSSIWMKVLVPIDQINQIIQARRATIDVEVANLRSLIKDLEDLRNRWSSILFKSKFVANAMNIQTEFPLRRKNKRRAFFDEDEQSHAELSVENEECAFEHRIFYVIVDSVIAGIGKRYDAANIVNNHFCFLWLYLEMSKDQIKLACKDFGKQYSEDISISELKEELFLLKSIHASNFGDENLSPLVLLNNISKFKLDEIMTNIFSL